jgi:hypothetical protein
MHTDTFQKLEDAAMTASGRAAILVTLVERVAQEIDALQKHGAIGSIAGWSELLFQAYEVSAAVKDVESYATSEAVFDAVAA